MNNPLRFIFTGILIAFLSQSCNNAAEKPAEVILDHKDTLASQPVPATQREYFMKTFEVKEEDKSLGWGYDIYIDSARTIHQPTIPAVSGIHHFKTEQDAARVGEFATKKMKATGAFPTLSIEELDSLGVIPKGQ